MENLKNKSSALLIIGNEILSGRTKDANTQYIGEAMSGHGVPLAEVRVVPDIEAVIVETLNEMRARFDFVFTTGALGRRMMILRRPVWPRRLMWSLDGMMGRMRFCIRIMGMRI